MEPLVVEIGLPAFLRQGDQHHAPVLFTSDPLHVTFLHKTVNRYGQCPCSHAKRFGHTRHIPGPFHIDRLDHMHVVGRYILIFSAADCPLLYDIDIAEKPHQHLI